MVVTRQSLSLRYQLAGDASVHSTGMGDVLTQQNWDAVAAALLAGTMPEGDRSVLVASHVADAYPEIAPGASLVVEGAGTRSPSPWRGSLTPPRRLPSEGATGTWGWTPPSSMPRRPVPAAAAGGGFPDYAWSVVSDPSQDQGVAAGLEALVANHPEVGLDTYASRVEAFRQSNTMIYDALEVVSWLILLFGGGEPGEHHPLQPAHPAAGAGHAPTLGMTRRQLGTMIAWEGLCYALTAAGGHPGHRPAGGCGGLPDGQFPLLRGDHRPLPVPPAGDGPLPGGVLFGLELLLSGWSIRREEKDGLLERIGQRP